MTATAQKNNSNLIAVLTMIFLFGMISFVTNLAAPIGNVWKMQPGIDGSNTLGMMGNMMNFLAYAFMGIPAGKMLARRGYKMTALIAIAVGFIGVFVQFLSGIVGVGSTLGGIPTNFFVYLLGAFIAGFSVCMLNTVVNPMLKILGGKRSNQYIQIGGSFNSLVGTLTPMLVGALIGTLTKRSAIADVNTVLFIAMGVFAVTFIALLFIPIEDPEKTASNEKAVSPLKYRHFVLGAIAIFVYVGVEVGIPGTLNFYLSDSVNGARLDPLFAAKIAGVIAGIYWLLMLVGRLVSSVISGKVSSRTQLSVVSSVALVLLLAAMVTPGKINMNFNIDKDGAHVMAIDAVVDLENELKEAENKDAYTPYLTQAKNMVDSEKYDKAALEGMSEFVKEFKYFEVNEKGVVEKAGVDTKALADNVEFKTEKAFVQVYKTMDADSRAPFDQPAEIPVAAILLILCGLCTSVMWGTIFDLSVEGLGAATEKASGIFMAMVVGGGIVPLVQNFVADKIGYMPSYWVLFACVAFILYFAVIGSRVKKN